MVRVLFLALLALLAFLAVWTAGPAFAGMNWLDAAERLQRERGAAVECAREVKHRVPSDNDNYFKAKQSYEKVRTEMNAVLARLDTALIVDKEDEVFTTLRPRLEAVALQRRAFCQEAETFIAAYRKEGEKNLLALLDIAGSFTDAAVEIWKEFREADDVRKNNLRTALEDARWPAFADIS